MPATPTTFKTSPLLPIRSLAMAALPMVVVGGIALVEPVARTAACGDPARTLHAESRSAVQEPPARSQRPDARPTLRYPSLWGNIRAELHMLPPVSTGPMSPSWSPDGGSIAFAMAGDIWRIPAAGGVAEQLTRGPWYHFEPSWSPDGGRIAMTVETGSGLDIAVLDLASGETSLVVEGGGADFQPAWGPDGQFVYFATGGRGMDVHRVEVATGRQEEVLGGPGHQYQARLSRQGRLAYMARAPGVTGTGGIWVDGGGAGGGQAGSASGAVNQAEPVLVRAEETAWRARPDWLPDGSGLVYVSDDAGSNDLVLIAADGGSPLRITEAPGHELTPSVSPDGGWIAFVSNDRGAATTLHVMPSTGGARSSWRTLEVGDRNHLGPMGALRGTVVDELGDTVPARVSIVASDGRGHSPADAFHRVLTPTETHHFRTAGVFELRLPAGPAAIQVRRGLEHRPVTVAVEIPAGGVADRTFELARLVDAAAMGWHGGDTHVHDLHQGRRHLTHKDFFNDLVAEDLGVSIALIHMDGTRLMGRWDDLTGRPHPLSTDTHILQYAQEFRGAFGHVGLAGVSEFVTPLIGGAARTPFAADRLNADYLEAGRAQGATVGYMHPFTAPVRYPEAAANSEIPVDVALQAGDFYDVICYWYDELGNAEMYYRILNAGFRVAATGGTDNFSDVWRDPGPGASRTYAYLGDRPLSSAAWLEAIRERRTFATNGPLLFATVDGVRPGGEIVVGGAEGAGAGAGGAVGSADGIDAAAGSDGASRRTYQVEVDVATNSPLDRVEVVVNGRIAESRDMQGRTGRYSVEAAVELEGSGWIAVRALGPASSLVSDSYAFAQTTPVWVVADGRVYRSADDVRFLLEAVEAFRRRVVERDMWATAEDRDRYLARVDEAAAVYRGLLER